MVAQAIDKAPHTSNGAIEVAVAFVRWLNQYPYPSAQDASEIEKVGVAPDAPTKDLAAFFASSPNLSGGLVPDNTSYYLSTIPGVFHLESASGQTVVASIGTGLVVSDVLSTTLRGSITVTVEWHDGHWMFTKSAGTRTTQNLYSIGIPFTRGC